MASGTVKWFDSKKGFGFISNEKGLDVFVHFSSILGDGFRALKDGEKVDYEEFTGEKGLSAKNVTRVASTVTAQRASNNGTDHLAVSGDVQHVANPGTSDSQG